MHPMRHIYILSVVILCLLSMVGGCRHAADMGVACEIREVAREQLQADSSRLVKDAIAAIDTIECSDAEAQSFVPAAASRPHTTVWNWIPPLDTRQGFL